MKIRAPAYDGKIQLEALTLKLRGSRMELTTVTDCFKYRNKLGVDIALEALRDCWQQKRCSMDELWHYARICRVQSVMRPYLESLV